MRWLILTDRHSAYIVVLENEIRDDDAKATVAALKQIKGVLGVEPVINSPDVHIAEMRARTVIRAKLWDALHDV